MDISSGNMHQLVAIMMSEVLAVGAIVYGGYYLVKRRAATQRPVFCTGTSVAAAETFVKRNTKVEVPNRQPAEAPEHSDSALV
jgi:hypothetical protein